MNTCTFRGGQLHAEYGDSQMGMCEWVSDSRESVWLANPCELQIRRAVAPQGLRIAVTAASVF